MLTLEQLRGLACPHDTNATVLAEKPGVFRIPAFIDDSDPRVGWQGMTIMTDGSKTTAQLDDGRRFVGDDALKLVEEALQEAACWQERE